MRELALKACIIKALLATDEFPEKDFTKDCYTNIVGKLIKLAKLKSTQEKATDADPELLANWALAEAWSEEKRYHRIDKHEAEDLYTAIADAAHGVLPWIKKHW